MQDDEFHSGTGEWEPKYISIEATFDEFVRGFPAAGRFEDFVGRVDDGLLNADYYFENDNVIGELKCLDADPEDAGLMWRRLEASFRHFGYSQVEMFGAMMRQEVPKEVMARVFRQASRSIVEAIKKANKQIRSSKEIVGRPDARGFVLIANNSNFGMNVRQIAGAIASGFWAIKDHHIDAIIYTTANVYHDDGTDVAKTYWIPIYNVGSEEFGDWVNTFGRAWFDYLERLQGPALERDQRERPDIAMMTARPVRLDR